MGFKIMISAEVNDELDKIYKDILEFACLNNNKSLVEQTIDLKKDSVYHNSFFKIACCKKSPDISNLFLEYNCKFNVNDELLEYAAITDCDNLRLNIFDLYKNYNHKPDLKKSVIQALKNNSKNWIDYFFSINYDFSLLNKKDIISILNVCDKNTCNILLNNISHDNLRNYSNFINNIENKRIIKNYLCSLAF